MSLNGSGVYVVNSAGQPVVSNTLITAAAFNAFTADVATALSTAVFKDGQQTITANLPMSGFVFTGLGSGVASRTRSSNIGDVQDGTLNWADGGGTADAITATYSPAITALVDGQICCVRATAANATTTPTFSPNGLTARTIVKGGGVALVAGDIKGDGHELILRYLLASTRWELLNPYVSTVGFAASGANSDITSLTAVTNITAATVTVDSANDLVYIQDASDSNKLKVVTASSISPSQIIPAVTPTFSGNAMTIPAPSSALSLDFRSTTAGSGAVTRVSGTPAALVISSGSTLGTVSAVQSDIVVVVMNNAGTLEYAVVNISGGNDLSETGFISTTAEGGAGAADSANVFYSTTARTNVAYRVVQIIRSTQATAGTWVTAASLIQGAGGNALVAMSSLGYGQVYSNVSGSRTSTTTYYNTTGKPILVIVTIGGGTASVSVGGVSIVPSTSSTQVPITFIVPCNMSYVVTNASIQYWAELR